MGGPRRLKPQINETKLRHDESCPSQATPLQKLGTGFGLFPERDESENPTDPVIVNIGHKRTLDLAVEVPSDAARAGGVE